MLTPDELGVLVLFPAKDQHLLLPSTIPTYQDTWKSWGSSLSLPPVCLLLLSSLCVVPPPVISKRKWEITSALFLCLLPLLHPPPPQAHAEPLAIGRWTASLSASLMNVKPKHSEGAKTKVLLRGIHCVNILAGEGAVVTIYRQRERCTRSYLTRSSPLHAPSWLISKSNIFVTEECRDFSLDLLQWCCCADVLHSSIYKKNQKNKKNPKNSHSRELGKAGN